MQVNSLDVVGRTLPVIVLPAPVWMALIFHFEPLCSIIEPALNIFFFQQILSRYRKTLHGLE